ncbi:MAG: cyclic pyranopterin monophosphate synthase MoaC [Thermodesulfovibrionales bacterium]|jgi:cyclic pyranopterin phosphate synthase|nr:cyclic pyranopterin monophosphate synthase MoaC [Thermodesulfovibrionales bacterium]
MKKLTHLDRQGRARMVDISKKPVTQREAVARCSVVMKRETLQLILDDQMPKGDVLAVARVAGIMAAKKTSELIPMCHPLKISSVAIEFKTDTEKNRIDIQSTVKVSGQTGVEMEALTATAIAGLTVYDMCKSVDKGMVITEVMLIGKKGGKSGVFRRGTVIR